MLVVPADAPPIIITPLMESEMVADMTWIANVHTWEDVGQRSWGRALEEALPNAPIAIWIEAMQIPAIVRNYLDECYRDVPLKDIGPLLGTQRMIKSPLEIEVMQQAGTIASAMMRGAHHSLREGMQEFESELAVIHAGTRAAATFRTDKGWERIVSPMIHNLQVLQAEPMPRWFIGGPR